MSTFNITIDGKVCSAESGETVLNVAKRSGIEIPTLCYHPLVKVYGACGVCVVEVEGSKKLMRACATEVREGMVVNTKGERAEKARKLALELLLSDHRGDCRAPCMRACPGHTDCQGYVGLIANGEYDEANKLIKEQIPLPASIGRVCPHPCETACRRKLVEEPISIAALKRFAADADLAKAENYMPEKAPATGKKVAIIGGGPAGLTMAYYLAQKGHGAEIFEAMPKAGGMLRYGIPQYRLPKEVLDKEISLVEKMGVKLNYNVKIGKDVMFEDLEKKFDAVYVAIGAWKSAPMRCEGEEAEGVLGGIDFLINVAQNKPTGMGKKVAVVGGGNTAMDACRTAVRLGAEKVYILYRRTQAEMPAEEIEISEAMEEGVEFKFLVAPTKIVVKDGKVAGIELQKMELGEPDASGRRKPVPIEGAVETVELDTIIAAIGQKVVPDGIPVKLTDWKTIAADKFTYQTDRKGVFAGGDGINNGPGIAIAAIGHAKEASDVIDSYLKGDVIPYSTPYVVTRDDDISEEDFLDKPKQSRAVPTVMAPADRKHNFSEVASTMTEEEAKKEASRCLECGCADYFECKLIKYGQEYDVNPERFGAERRRRETADDHMYIERNAEKCILCGLCVRVCEEVSGAGVLGLVNRGFDTVVKPEFGKPLDQTKCLSCGQCVALCPTGALLEKWTGKKRVPLKEDKVSSVCSKCGMGCKTELAVKGNMVCRSLAEDDGELCKGGRFAGIAEADENRLTTALVDGKPATFVEAVAEWKKKAEAIGKENIAVAIAPTLTLKEMSTAKSLAVALGTDAVGSLSEPDTGCAEATVFPEKVMESDFVLYVGKDPMECHAVFGMGLRGKDIPFALICDKESLLSDAAKFTETGDIKTLVSEIVMGKAGTMLKNAKNPVLVWDKNSLDVETTALLKTAAAACGVKDLLALRSACNSVGIERLGVLGSEKFKKRIAEKKGIVAVGEDIYGMDTSAFKLVVLLTSKNDEAAKKADIALPLAAFTECSGVYINSYGEEQQINAARASLTGIPNEDIISLLK